MANPICAQESDGPCICFGTQNFNARCDLCSCRGELGEVCADDPCACIETLSDDA